MFPALCTRNRPDWRAFECRHRLAQFLVPGGKSANAPSSISGRMA